MIETAQTWQIGDCLELMQDMSDNSIDLVLTDPPYGISYHSGWYKGGNPHAPIENDDTFHTEFNEIWMETCSLKSKDTSSILLFSSHQVLTKWIPLVNKYWDVKNIIVWVKNNWTAGDLSGNLGNQYECIIFGSRGKFVLNGYRYSNVWNFDRVPPNGHPTPKPVPLLKRGIEFTTHEGDMVLDPFLGSGTTSRACRETNRNCIGFEINPEYDPIIKEQCMSHTPALQSYF